MFIPLFSLALTSCGDDDNDEPDNTNGNNPKYEVHQFVEAYTPGSIDCSIPISFTDVNGDDMKFCNVTISTNGNYLDFKEAIGFNRDYYSRANNVRLATIDNISGLSQIQSISDLQWINFEYGQSNRVLNSDCFLLKEKTGYILEGSYGGRVYYIRIFISKFNYNSENTIVGVEGEFQQLKPK